MTSGAEINLLTALSSFLGGVLITMIIFVFKIMDRLGRAENALTTLNKTVETLDIRRPICPMHEELKGELAALRQSEALTEQRMKQHTGS